MSEDGIRYDCLCSTCKNASSCTFPRDPDKPTFNCEEFEIEETPFVRPAGIEPLPAMDSATGEPDAAELVGLCSDCENRLSCTFQRPEGGIWHCEEYR